jgi:hypothetical protein
MATRPRSMTLGHEVDLLLASELLGAAADQETTQAAPAGLHVCPACTLPFVVAGDVRELVGVDRVRLDLRCTNCGWAATAVHDDTELAALDMQIDRTFADLLWTLEVVWIANEEAAIARFAAALAADAILPDDLS